MAYTETDAADFRTRLTDPNGIFAADPVRQAQLVAEHDARVEHLKANGSLAPAPAAYDPAEHLGDPRQRPITELNSGFVDLVNENLERLDGVPDTTLAAMATSKEILAQVESDQHYQASRRTYNSETQRWEHLTPQQYLDELAEAAKPMIAAIASEGSPADILARAKTNFRLLQSMAAMASRLPK